MNAPSSNAVRRVLDRWILLRSAEGRAEALPASRRRRAATLLVGARARRDAALASRGVAALILARSALHAYLEVVVMLTADAPPEDATLATLWGLHDAATANGRLPPLPSTFDDARERALAVQPPDDELAQHGEARADETLALVDHFARWIDLRTPRRIRLDRRARQLGLVVVIALFVLGMKELRPRAPSVAFHPGVVAKPARPEGLRPGRPASQAGAPGAH